ncbi:4895_t:CDS:2, partial [Racocetra persica]
NDFDNSGPNQESANTIINNELASGSHEAEQSTQTQSMQANSNTELDLYTTSLSRKSS